ncbi:MAG TPA: hypothetical protein PKM73_12395 [Verrucomicrobiota bacterium]|nr:hypothetical protein [Verrucomicrobiota bacterium]HNU51463.1 hypothetical protein [Verrucomicrobiota bacterium]
MEPRTTWKERLAERYADRALLRLLIVQPAFRAVFLIALAGVIGMLIALPKFWTVSPPGFRPVVRISLVDLVQARALKASGYRLAAAGREDEAAMAWQGAAANNPADAEVHREALNQLVRNDRLSRKYISEAISQTGWLLRLGGTNSADLELATRVYDKYGLASDLYRLLQPVRDTLSPEQEVPYMKAAFQSQEIEEFTRFWLRREEHGAADPELALYHAAYLAGWGPIERAREGRRRLVEVPLDSPHGLLARRLLLAVSVKLMDPVEYVRVLEELEAAGADRLSDRLGYWRLLGSVGRKEEARQLAQGFVLPPRWPWEVTDLAETLISLGMRDHALATVRRYLPEYGQHGGPWAMAMWLTQGDLLIEDGRWSELLDVATQLRFNEWLAGEMGGYIRYIEGRAHLGLGHTELAAVAFERVRDGEFPMPEVAHLVAGELRKLGHLAVARDVLRRIEPDMANDPAFWATVLKVADVMKEDSVLLLKAAARGRQLQPQNPSWDADYALALIANRQAPAELIVLTREMAAEASDRPEPRVTHSAALAMNGRYDEADALLRTVKLEDLNDYGASAYHLCAVDIHFHRGEFDRAREDIERINRRHLFPIQRDWLEQVRGALSVRGGNAR